MKIPTFKNRINIIDCHTEGEPTRIIIDGLPEILGNTMGEKRDYFKENYDQLRKAIILEPRGHNDMFGAVLTKPCNPQADVGVFFMDGKGYLNMCGHGTIALVTVLYEKKLLKRKGPLTEFTFDTPAGLIRAKATIERGKIKHVTLENVHSFVYKENVKISLENKIINAQIAFGGNFFALIKAKDVGLEICSKNINAFINLGTTVLEMINKIEKVKHPTLDISSIDLVEFYEDREKTQASRSARNVVIFGNGQYDRSPCGTGTSAKIASMIAKKELQVNQLFVNIGILGTKFFGRATARTKVGAFDAVIPEITGSAYITGIQTLILHPEDPFKHGFDSNSH